MKTQDAKWSGDLVRSVLMTLIIGLAVPFPSEVFAQGTSPAKDFADTLAAIMVQIGGVPNLISAFAFVGGIMLIVSGVLKLKAHAENPGNVKIEVGLARLFAGGVLVSLPVFAQWVLNSISIGGTQAPPFIKITPGFGS